MALYLQVMQPAYAVGQLSYGVAAQVQRFQASQQANTGRKALNLVA